MRVFISVIVTSVLLACAASEPTIQTGPDAEIVDRNLHRVDNSRADLAYVDPDIDFTRYRRILVDPLGVDNVEIISPPRSGATRTSRGDWELSERDRAQLREMFATAMQRSFNEKGSYPIVGEPEDDVLRITATLTAIAPNAPPDSGGSRTIGRSRVYTEGAGTLYIKVVFSDSESGEVLALIKDSKDGSSTWGVNNRAANMGEARRVFNTWATSIRASLDRIDGKI